jgi:hypothetical protein
MIFFDIYTLNFKSPIKDFCNEAVISAGPISVWYLGFSENTDNGEEITRQVFSTFEHEVVTTKNEKGRGI